MGFGLLGLLGLVLVAAAVGIAYLQSDAGAEKIRGVAIGKANALVKGRFALGRLDVRGTTLIIEGFELRDPEGALVAQIARLEVEPSVLQLAQRTLNLREVRLQGVRLYLVSDERGLNLTRAIELKELVPPEPEDPNATPSRLRLAVGKLSLREGYVDFEQRGEDGARQVRAEQLSADGSLEYLSIGQKATAKLTLQGELTRPLKGPLHLTLDSDGDEQDRQAAVALALPGAKAELAATVKGEDAASIAAQLKALHAEPATARAFVTGWPLEQAVDVTGTASKHGDAVQANLELSAGKAKLWVDGSADVKTLVSQGLTVKGSGLDLAELFGGKRHTALALQLHARGGGRSLSTLSGEATLEVPRSQVQGAVLGPVRVLASAKDGRFSLSQLAATLPGVSLSATGEGDLKRLRADGRLHASDLGELSATFGGLLPGGAPKLAGRGTLTFHVEGPVEGPAVTAEGDFERLAAASVNASGLTLRARVPDVRRPLDADGVLSARKLDLSGKTLSDVALELKTNGPELLATARTRGFAEASLTVGGRVDADAQGLALSALSLQLPEGTWALERPSHLSFANGLEVAPLLLRSGEQRLSLQAHQQGKRLTARAAVERLELARLPKALVAPELKLAGLLDATLDLSGSSAAPKVSATAKLREGRVRDVEHLSADVTAGWAQQTVTGELKLLAPFAQLEGTVLLPLEAMRRRRQDKVAVALQLRQVKLKEAVAALAPQQALEGELEGSVTLEGPAEDPDLTLELHASKVRYPTAAEAALEVPTATLRVDNAAARKLSARVDAQALGGTLWTSVKSRLSLHQLLFDPPSAEELAREAGEVQLQVDGVKLPELKKAGLTAAPLQGTANVQALLQGTAQALTGKLQAQLSAFAAAQLPPAEVALTLAAEPKALTAQLTATRSAKQIAKLDARFLAPLEQVVRSLDAVAATPLTVSGTFGPLSMEELQRLTAVDPEIPPEQLLAGTVGADLSASGTLESPRLSLRVAADQLGVGATRVGDATLSVGFQDGRGELRTAMRSSGGGTLNLAARTQLPLSWSGLKKGLALNQAPLDATLTANAFDVGFARGFLPSLRKLKGALDGDVRVQGKIGAPALKGDLRLKDGEIALLGYGEYRAVQLDVHATESSYALRELSAKAGAGWVKVKAEGERAGEAFTLRGTTQSEKFPIVTDDQVLALVDHQSTLEGELSAQLVNLREVYIHRARVELPEVKRKDLQELDRPADIVLVRNGKPVEKRKRKPSRGATASGSVPGGPATGGSGAAQQEPALVSEEPARRYSARIVAPKNIWVTGTDVNLEVGISDALQIEVGEETTMFGEIHVGPRARVDVLGRRFDLKEDSTVRFSGPPKTPYVNATAIYNNEKEGVVVYVSVRGQGRDLTLKPSSQPPLSESEIYTLLATGRRTLKRGSGTSMSAGAQAATLLTSFAASQLKKTLAAKLPLDVISIEAGEEGLVGTKLDVGKYVTEDLYIGYTGKYGADPLKKENANAVRLEYQIGKHWNFELEYGDARTGGADLIWNHEF